jgi:hypothetical protein
MITSRRITQSAVAAALGALVLFLGHALQFGEFFWYLLASSFLLVCLVQMGYLGGFMCLVSMVILTFFLTSDFVYVIPFAILGFIPFIDQWLRDLHVGRMITFILGMLIFDVAVVSTFLIFENPLLAYLPDFLESVYPTAHHVILYVIYFAEAFVIGIPSYLAYSLGLAKAKLKLRFLLQRDIRHEAKSSQKHGKRAR